MGEKDANGYMAWESHISKETSPLGPTTDTKESRDS